MSKVLFYIKCCKAPRLQHMRLTSNFDLYTRLYAHFEFFYDSKPGLKTNCIDLATRIKKLLFLTLVEN